MNYTIEEERIYACGEDGRVLARITFPQEPEGIFTIDHTFVDESLRGRGVAAELVRLAAGKILSAGGRIAATCPYAVAWLQRHPEYPLCDTGAPAACPLRPKR